MSSVAATITAIAQTGGVKRALDGTKEDDPPEKRTAPLQKYWFWSEVCLSFTRDELIEYIKELHKRGTGLVRSSTGYNVNCGMPLDKHIQQVLTEEVWLDVDRTAGRDTCSLTGWKYNEPCMLNIDGRTYNRDDIVRHLDNSLKAGKPLQLGDIIVTPQQSDCVQVYKHLGRQDTSSGEIYRIYYIFCDRPEIKFDLNKCKQRNIPEMSTWLHQCFGRNNSNQAEVRYELIQKYSARRRVLPVVTSPLFFEDLMIERVVLYSDPSYRTVFSNVRFGSCVLISVDDGDFTFTGCAFNCCKFVDGRAGFSFDACEFCASDVLTDPDYNGTDVPDCTEHFVHPDVLQKLCTREDAKEEYSREYEHSRVSRIIGILTGMLKAKAEDTVRYRLWHNNKWFEEVPE